MLVNLTPNEIEIERRKQIAIDESFEYIPQSDPQWLQETGIYQSSFPFNFPCEEFSENLITGDNYIDMMYQKYKKEGESLLGYFIRSKLKNTYGVADNIEQIKEFYKKQIKDKKNKYVIAVTPVFQEKENKGKGGGWRWHKWGRYIGKLNQQCEYLDDEDFGDDFQYVLVFELYLVTN